MAPSRSELRAQVMNPTPQYLKDLVLDYLMHNCHTGAARAFMKECGVTPADGETDRDRDAVIFVPGHKPHKTSEEELRTLEERLAMGELHIRNHILTGRIDEATELLHKHFPTVLSDTPEPGAIPPSIYLFKYRPATSTDPTHLALNLRIQAFIEAARTIPLPYYPPGSESPLPQPPLLSAAGRTASSGDGEDVDMSESDTELSNAQLLHRAQSLYSEVNRLSQANDRAMYLGELGQVGGILAYTVPERSPLAMYMTQARREAVADQIDSAILYWAKKPTISRIELYTRQTGVEWSLLHEKEIPAPPRNKWPAGVSLPPTGLPDPTISIRDGGSLENAVPPPKKASTEKETDEVIPPFDLHLFVESQVGR
ncbi:uncharacterized protein TRAVEDRAFT_45598 [Trametes versicolor FP-101664 SS1]|uniref:uncharacterized protein n=1 Tax=Trametes versicolor (strain FP-101664) TaxID=717944 RepID=UPI00046248CA|nr:uncharacterized protein TRAVEDRAFT_45598 [Trametes versicolor FP-101664 SS1]EIW60346.1 hypothetical protein TRAVEDRAFT_45598 [Trametes versicolor FP-101664 SS1]